MAEKNKKRYVKQSGRMQLAGASRNIGAICTGV